MSIAQVFTFCAHEPSVTGNDQPFAQVTTAPDYREVIKYINTRKAKHGNDCKYICAYEAGCLGYTLYHQLTDHEVECVILAPTTLLNPVGKRVKTDKRDAENIARSLA